MVIGKKGEIKTSCKYPELQQTQALCNKPVADSSLHVCIPGNTGHLYKEHILHI